MMAPVIRMKYFITGVAGFHRQQPRRPADRGGPRGRRLGRLFDRPGAVSWRTRERNPLFRLVRGDNLDLPALTAGWPGASSCFTSARMRTCVSAWSIPARICSKTPWRPSTCSKPCAPTASASIGFSSTGSVYGESTVIPTPEDAPFPIQTSLYAASKVAGENMIQAYCEGYGLEGYIFRFVSILGERYTHGHVFDFYKQLLEHPDHLRVLGDGTQRKSYLYVQDCLEAMLHVTRAMAPRAGPGTGSRSTISARSHIAGSERLDRLDQRTPRAGSRNCISPAVNAVGWATTRSSFLDTAKVRSDGLGFQDSRSGRASFAPSRGWKKIAGYSNDARAFSWSVAAISCSHGTPMPCPVPLAMIRQRSAVATTQLRVI